jgi:hypothetical protein
VTSLFSAITREARAPRETSNVVLAYQGHKRHDRQSSGPAPGAERHQDEAEDMGGESVDDGQNFPTKSGGGRAKRRGR